MAREKQRGTVRGATRSKILNTLKKSDGLTADQLGEILGITAMAVRKHLNAMERDDLVESVAVKRPIGRPAHLYRLSAKADDEFPRTYDVLLTDLLSDIETIDGHEKVNTLLMRRAERTRESLATYINKDAPLEERVADLTRAMDEMGYLAMWEKRDDGTCLIKLYNCAINRVAAEFPAVCSFEAGMFRDVLHADIERACHMLTGDHLCSYVARERSEDSVPRITLLAQTSR